MCTYPMDDIAALATYFYVVTSKGSPTSMFAHEDGSNSRIIFFVLLYVIVAVVGQHV